MMKNYRSLLFLTLYINLPNLYFSQKNDKIWMDGQGRSFFSSDAKINEEDTISASNISSGYNLIDLNTHINPFKTVEIFGQVRIKNEFGSFFGSGTQIDVRQLRASGIIKNKVKFSVGDLFLKQNKFTLHNYDEELNLFENNFNNSYKEIVDYENFYFENRWRLQGIQTNFSYKFDRFIRTLEFDFFTTRPRGSSQINSGSNTFISDMLISGGSMVSKLNKSFTAELNYVFLKELPATGTVERAIRNPVYQIGINYNNKSESSIINHKLQAGFSERNWSYKSVDDSTSELKQGMFAEFSSSYFKIDSTFSLNFGYRYVDPNFRSSGAQTRRIDMNETNVGTIYSLYSNNYLIRPISVFDIVTDPNIYNQNISGTLMSFNPIFSNALPYGDATPNRQGIFLDGSYSSKNKIFKINFKSSYFNEVIGQGTTQKRNFFTFLHSSNINLKEIFNHTKEFGLSFSTMNQITSRKGDSLEIVNLNTQNFNLLIEKEILNKLFLQLSLKRFESTGNEYINKRNDYGEIFTFQLLDLTRVDNLYCYGIKYKYRENVYINLQYNLWNSNFNNINSPDLNFQRFLFIFSVKL